jgi:excisionase family DNA binding protein
MEFTSMNVSGTRFEPSAWLTKDEAADRARCTTRTIERALADGELRAVGTPDKIAIRADELDAWRSGAGLRDTRPTRADPAPRRELVEAVFERLVRRLEEMEGTSPEAADALQAALFLRDEIGFKSADLPRTMAGGDSSPPYPGP